MANAIILHDKTTIARFLRQDIFLHLYSLGDLDDFFWPYTIWFGLELNRQVQAIILLFTAQPLPILLALSADLDPLVELLTSVRELLPRRFYGHFTPGLEPVLQEQFQLESYGQHCKMALQDRSHLAGIAVSAVTRLAEEDMAAIQKIYDLSYPGHWFDPRMLQTGQYFGIKHGSDLVSIAGVHVYSKSYGVAALGNITTHPDYRGKGLGQAVTTRLCQSLSETVKHIGLNVKVNNQPAIALYRKLGFEIIANYGEYMVEAFSARHNNTADIPSPIVNQ